MDRKKITEAIQNVYMNFGPLNQRHVLEEALKRISDTNLLALALDLGIDTDSILQPELRP